MIHPLRAVALFLSLFVLIAGIDQADEPVLAPVTGLLVLRNGRILDGQITLAGDHFLVTLGPDSVARVPAGDVEFQCRSLDEAYLRKRDALARGGIEAHLALADWCLNQRLLARAADQLFVALSLDPNHPQAARLERRLEVAADLDKKKSPVGSAAPTFVVQRKSATSEPERKSDPLPLGTLESFTISVQPVLLNRCGAASCHGTNSPSQFKLVRPAAGHTVAKRYTERNLAATLALLDRHHPNASPLLTAAAAPHGQSKTPIFAEKDAAQLEQLAVWVRQTVQAKGVLASRAPAAAPGVASQTPASTEPATRNSDRPRSETTDPFDPETFNRRFSRQK